MLKALGEMADLGFDYIELEGFGDDNLQQVIANTPVIKQNLQDTGLKLSSFAVLLPETISLDRARREKALTCSNGELRPRPLSVRPTSTTVICRRSRSRPAAQEVPKDSPARHPSGRNLYELVDVFIDNHLPLGDAVVEVPGVRQKIGPTSTFANSFTINLLMLGTAEKLAAMGVEPPIWTSANMPGGDKLNQKYEEMYIPRVKHLR